MTSYKISEIRREPLAARRAYRHLNDQGKGFDPEPEIEEWQLLRAAETTDDVAVYVGTDGEGDEWTYLVGTDGTGSDESRWAVRVGDAGLDIPDRD